MPVEDSPAQAQAKKRRNAWLLLGFVGGLLLIGCVIGVAVTASTLRKLEGEAVFFDPVARLYDTTYAPGYSHQRFARVKVGMTKEEVLVLLGEPMTRDSYAKDEEMWEYSQAARCGGMPYRLRAIGFRLGTVFAIDCVFSFRDRIK